MKGEDGKPLLEKQCDHIDFSFNLSHFYLHINFFFVLQVLSTGLLFDLGTIRCSIETCLAITCFLTLVNAEKPL